MAAPRATLSVPSVRDLRARLGMTCAELAEAMGVHPVTVFTWQRTGKMKPHMALALLGLAVRLGDQQVSSEMLSVLGASLTSSGSGVHTPGARGGPVAEPQSILWERAYKWIRVIEGGFFNHPNDPGGATYAGVSLRAVVKLDLDADGKLDFDLDGDGDVDAADIAALRDHPERIEAFYRAEYWDKVRADEMGWPWGMLAFDASVHHGVSAAALLVQRALGVAADGRVGTQTLTATRTASAPYVRRYFVERSWLMYRIALKQAREQSYPADRSPFYRGWQRRLFDLHAETARL